MPLKLEERDISDKHKGLKFPNRREVNPFAVCKHDRGFVLVSTKKQLLPALWSELDLNPRPPDFKCNLCFTACLFSFIESTAS